MSHKSVGQEIGKKMDEIACKVCKGGYLYIAAIFDFDSGNIILAHNGRDKKTAKVLASSLYESVADDTAMIEEGTF